MKLFDFIVRNWYLFVMLALILAMLFQDGLRRRLSGVANVDPAELSLLTNREPTVIVHVGEASEYKEAHIPQSVNLPLKELLANPQMLQKHRSKTVALVCRSGNRSAVAGRHLRKHGFEKVVNLAGGLLAWEKENLPLERG